MKKLFTQFSFPGGISSHVAPTTPGSIHEGGELGYSLSHAFGAAFDNPADRRVRHRRRRGRDRTAGHRWQSNKFLNPVSDGAVLPILHLNGYKISNPTVLARIENEELEQFLRGCGWDAALCRRLPAGRDAPAHGRAPWTKPLSPASGRSRTRPDSR
jgi:xylulose-5-phosphate/fructose-6-phosphate phosphoketolase